MEPGEALGIAAQVAVTLAGFAGVVVVFRRESIHEWSPADRHLEMVQRVRLGGFRAVRHSDDEDVSSVGSATDTNRALYPTCLLSVRNLGYSGKPLATIQR